MLKRIYIDNFRCLVNFELTVGSNNLFLGPNGSGKSTVYDVLRRIQTFINGEEKVIGLFFPGDLTRWQTSWTQSFELEIEGHGGIYKYELAIEHNEQQPIAVKVAYERLWFNNKPLLTFEAETVQLHLNNYSESQKYPLAPSQSAFATLPPTLDARLTWFKERVKRFIIVQINPMLMTARSEQEETRISANMENFVSWYRYVSQDQGKVFEITKALSDILKGFNNFKFEPLGEQNYLLTLHFSKGNGKTHIYRFNELSDGQRVLIALYALIYYARSEDYTLCIDEPENYIALPEIQPWLTLLYDFCSDGELQALLISHHPELIDYLASSAGYWFDHRGSSTSTRVKRITDNEGGVPISELVARGWLDG